MELIFTSYAQDPEVSRYLPWGPHQNKTETRASVKRLLTNDHTGLSLNWIIQKIGER